MISYNLIGKFTASVKLRTRINFVRQLHWPHRKATDILYVLVLLVCNIATRLNFCWFMSSRNDISPFLASRMPFQRLHSNQD